MKINNWLAIASAAIFISGCNQASNSSSTASSSRSPQQTAETVEIDIDYKLTALQANQLTRSAEFVAGEISQPGTPALLVSTAAGPYNFSNGNQLTFHLDHTSATGELFSYPISLSQSIAAVAETSSEEEVAQAIQNQVGSDLLITHSPLTIQGAGGNSEGATLQIIPVSATGVSLTDLGFADGNRLNTGSEKITSADYIFTGILNTNNTTTGEFLSFDWSIYVDDTTFEVQSNQSILLTPGDYTFDLLVQNNDSHYVASSTQTITSGTSSITMTVTPVIGNQNLNFDVTEQSLPSTLTRYQFHYPAEQLVNLSPARMGIVINDGAESLYDFNPGTGLSDVYLNLDPGAQKIELFLYNGAVLVGRSIPQQENQTISAGQSLAMDIVPQYGEVQLVLTENGGTANLNFMIPAQVDVEAGGAHNVRGKVTVVSPRNPLQEFTFDTPLNPEGIALTNLHYDNITLVIEFEEVDSGDILATCSMEWSLQQIAENAFCNLNLRRKSVIAGNILSSIALNVTNNNSEPMAGIVIKDQNENILGITGSSAFGTPGYLKIDTIPGTYTFTASNPAGLEEGSVFITTQALELSTANLMISQPPQPISCSTIHMNSPTANSGFYYIDLDGIVPAPTFGVTDNDPFRIYCDMETNGGGWALIAAHTDNTPVSISTDIAPEIGTGVIDDTQWQALKNSMNMGFMLLDENNLMTTVSHPTLNSASCINPFNDIASLAGISSLFHHQIGSCDKISNPYSAINLEADSPIGASLIQSIDAPFDIWPYADDDSSDEQDKLLYFVQ